MLNARHPIYVALAGLLALGPWFALLTEPVWPAPRAAASTDYSLRSKVDGVRAVPLDRLPPAPAGERTDSGCASLFFKLPQSSGAKAAARRGWMVLDERRLGGLQIVVITSGLDQGTSGLCPLRNSNIAIYDHTKLVGVIYPESDLVTLGALERLDDDRLRVWAGGGFKMAVGDLVLSGQSVTFGPLASSDPVCDGEAFIPSVFGKSIQIARTILSDSGWHPVAHPRPDDIVASDDWDAGLKEVDACAGTGLGYCAFDYSQGDLTLSITTIGEPPMVADYRVDCGGR